MVILLNTYCGNNDGCIFSIPNLNELIILGGIKCPNDTTIPTSHSFDKISSSHDDNVDGIFQFFIRKSVSFGRQWYLMLFSWHHDIGPIVFVFFVKGVTTSSWETALHCFKCCKLPRVTKSEPKTSIFIVRRSIVAGLYWNSQKV